VSNDQINGWKTVPFRVVNLYFSCCKMLDFKPSWVGLRDFVNCNPRLMEENVA
jgi:hypothetical protein